MANKRTAASQAIKDMLEANMDTRMFIGEINLVHELNEMIGITEKYAELPKKVEVKVEVKVVVHNYIPPEALKPLPLKKYVINPDGTISSYCVNTMMDWDRD